MCTKWNLITFRGGVLSYKERCSRPAIEGSNLCAYHAARAEQKSLPWGKRKDYQQVSHHVFFKSGLPMKLKTDVGNILYKNKNGVIHRFNKKLQIYEPTNLPMDVNLFCIKKL